MRVWNSLDEVPTDLPRTVVTLGNFDGVHRGHREVLRRVVELARARGALAVAVTFTPHPRAVHQPEVPHVDIISPEQRVVLLEEAGLDAVLLQRYTLEFADQSPEEFVRGMLVHGLHAAVVVVGHDVRFGRGNTGDVAEMVRLGAHYGFEVEAVEEFPAEHGAEPERRCSSTWVREALDAGDVAQAAAVLGRHHVLTGEVVHGFARGRELGFPTANLETDVQGMIPADGVYAGWVHDAHGGVWPAAISIGSNPTFEDVSRVVEAHVIDRHDERVEDFDLYGQHIEVEFVARLRGMVAYEGVEKLVAQITQDVDEARAILATTPSDR
ncbi:riboflavin biosynthesis protein RibF [Micrococcus luteus]|jgi:riboflavin kinase/FMN adenylyltransferase|uniref:Riboflavin biosynthesis protein n=1 Tax=Micrococcus luteus (strain ATCC 4698 / DSM 20030 / JCM 1464 / CCM 169 / CCUG 5858 / IAM 1056 / NBRC 3333 / NCIMB 9278 / NCTC 2665 / VKM Ac-2230) TaxID=465515 RepID=C5C9T6_MICLC|nr:bifunctional riboflavin kinase/FAD synthetase [Micrococcus luteus]ACS30238.1 FMN adenylyltransferase /riboflavin kinase [Micrococcus luteus NCTC 2665]AJO55352.1 riboflavin kinase [Micrococcus luteus]KAB1903498.1 bifunctional riboflavin kinase/FAD synthetase [Micrococcus luteus NCTC 2665]ORE63401.1 riboflavin biosynthesis protein RibF [Micrococcus luteus]QCY43842.1 bifunctional riboflavin kinase/FAD synthetase [Micrococcus luteus]